MAATLPGAAAKIRKWVLEASEDDMELILRSLRIQIVASHQQVQIEGRVLVMVPDTNNLVTIAQTSGCMYSERLATTSHPFECLYFERPLDYEYRPPRRVNYGGTSLTIGKLVRIRRIR